MNAFTRAWRVSAVMAVSALAPAHQALAISDNGTLTVGSQFDFNICGSGDFWWGYVPGWMGSYNPTGLTGGKTVTQILEYASTCGGNFTSVQISGFAANPGKLWLTSITCNGVTKTGATASFGYGSGVASWMWGGGLLFGQGGQTLSCTITQP